MKVNLQCPPSGKERKERNSTVKHVSHRVIKDALILLHSHDVEMLNAFRSFSKSSS